MVARHPRSHVGTPRNALPTVWLMTDERMGEALWAALAALPAGSGVMFRHFATAEPIRAAIFDRVARIARRRHLVVVQAGERHPAIVIRPAHTLREAHTARGHGADLVFVSPIYPTRTHPGGRSLGPLRAATIARAAGIPAIALGGITQARFKRLKAMGFTGWAAIDGLTP